MLMLMRLNGIIMSYTQEELIDLGMSAGAGTLCYNDILSWIETHTVK